MNNRVINVHPTLGEPESNQVISLAYISIPSILEHYDACEVYENDKCENDFQDRDLPTETRHNSSELTDILYATPVCQSVLDKAQNVVTITPRKSAKFSTPVKKQLTRKRKSNPDNWKRNVRKKLKLSGQEYKSATGKTVTEKKIQTCDCSKCKFKCDKMSR